jgi:hypothetical protein
MLTGEIAAAVRADALTQAALVFAAALAIATTLAAAPAEQRPDPVVELRTFVERFTGPQPVDCGQHLLVRADRLSLPAAETELRRSLVCGMNATKLHKAFWTFTQNPGIDSWIAEGLLGTSAGAAYRFSYDSAPCGGPRCPGRFSIERCEDPAVATDRYGHADFQCRRGGG